MKLVSYLLLSVLCCYVSSSFAQDDDQLAIGTVVKMTFEGQAVEAELVGRAVINKELEDEHLVMNINETLLGAEREAQILPVVFKMVDEPIADDIFIFALETDQAETLTLELFDGEGFTMLLKCTFEVEVGWSHKVLDLGVLKNGDYVLRLKNKEKQELNRMITVDKS